MTQFADKALVARMYGGSYDWSTFALFKDSAGRLYTASDSGCSCNGAWEYEPDFTSVDSVHAAIAEARSLVSDGIFDYTKADLDQFIAEALEV